MASSNLIVFLHGIGASGAQLMPLATSWRSSFPDVRFVAPDAPYQHRRGHQWFPVDGRQLEPERIEAVRRSFDVLITDTIKQEGFDNRLDRVAFVGVSQGAIVGLDGVASGRWRLGAMVSFAGLLAPMPVSTESARTPILLVHGQDDRVIPSFASTFAAAQLRGAGYDVELSIQPGVGHTISPGGADLAAAFLKRHIQ